MDTSKDDVSVCRDQALVCESELLEDDAEVQELENVSSRLERL